LSGQIWTAPNQLTLLRLIFIPFIIISVLESEYPWAVGLFVLAGISDALDGMLARWLKQKTVLGQYLDPIADKLLLSSLFLVLSFVKLIPWKFTILVFSRDVLILVISAVLYATTSLRDFRPSLWGKLNTLAQIAAVFVVMVAQIWAEPWVEITRAGLLWAVFALTIISGVHYVIVTGQRLRGQAPPPEA
jgi:cardiolipin synthase